MQFFSTLFRSIAILFVFLTNINAQNNAYYLRSSLLLGGESPTNNLFPVLCSTSDALGKVYTAASVLGSSGTREIQISVDKPDGQLLWNQAFHLDVSGDTYCGALSLDPFGNLLLTGTGWNGISNKYDLYLAKYSPSGVLLWQQSFNGAGQTYDGGTAIVSTSNGDIYVAGGTMQSAINMDIIVRKYNSNGIIQWSQTWDNTGIIDIAKSISISAGKIVVSGITQKSASTWEYVFFNINSDTGSISQLNVTDSGGISIDQITAGTQDAEGNYYITGGMGSTGQGLNVKTIKLDNQLNIIWTSIWNGPANMDDSARGLSIDNSGNLYIVGYSSNSNGKDGLLLKYNSSGQLLWSKTMELTKNDDEFKGIQLTTDQQLFVVGYQTENGNRDLYAAVLNSNNGDTQWSDTYNGYKNKNDEAATVVADAQGNFTVGGWADGSSPVGGKVLQIRYTKHQLVTPANEGVSAYLIENRGQIINTDQQPEPSIRFYCGGTYPNAYLTDNTVHYVFAHTDEDNQTMDSLIKVSMSFANSTNQRPPLAEGLEEQEGYHNYYLGYLGEGLERVPLVNKVLQSNIYPNIDAQYGTGPDGLFIRFICKPGSNPNQIELSFLGQNSLSILANGSLKVGTALEPLLLKSPKASLVSSNGVETNTTWTPAFTSNPNGNVNITVGTVPTDQTLIIKIGRGREDAECTEYWSTYFGDSGREIVLGSDVNEQNNDMYFTGNTSSPQFPTTLGVFQTQFLGIVNAYLACFSQQDFTKWITLHGGIEPAGRTETGYSVASNNANGSLYYVGRTTAKDFPLKVASGHNDDSAPSFIDEIYSRGFIGRFNQSSGVAEWISFIGDRHARTEAALTLDILSNGHIVLGGYSTSNLATTLFDFTPNFGYQQNQGIAFVSEFDTENNLIWSTRLTNTLSAENSVVDISEGNNGELWIYGKIEGDDNIDNMPLGQGAVSFNGGTRDAFLMKFGSSREILWGSFIGGKDEEYPTSIESSQDGGVFLSGSTTSKNFPVLAVGDPSDIKRNNTIHSGGTDIYVSKYSQDYNLIWSRFFSSANQGIFNLKSLDFSIGSVGNSMTMDQSGNLLLTGNGVEGFSPLVAATACSPSFFYPTPKLTDAIVLAISPDFFVTFSTFWGGNATDRGWTISSGYNPVKNLDFIIFGGLTESGNGEADKIPLCKESPFAQNPFFQGARNGTNDGFISKIYLQNCKVVDASEIPNPMSDWSIVPNPASNTLSIILPEGGQYIPSCSIYDIMGSLKSTFLFNEIDQTINIETLPVGVYIIRLNTADANTHAIKFIKL